MASYITKDERLWLLTEQRFVGYGVSRNKNEWVPVSHRIKIGYGFSHNES